jgi:hypothetical protein
MGQFSRKDYLAIPFGTLRVSLHQCDPGRLATWINLEGDRWRIVYAYGFENDREGKSTVDGCFPFRQEPSSCTRMDRLLWCFVGV